MTDAPVPAEKCEPGWIEYTCCVCDQRTRFAIHADAVVDQLTMRLGLPCPACRALTLIDHIQYPVNVYGTGAVPYTRTADETVGDKEERLRAAACGIAWNENDTIEN